MDGANLDKQGLLIVKFAGTNPKMKSYAWLVQAQAFWLAENFWIANWSAQTGRCINLCGLCLDRIFPDQKVEAKVTNFSWIFRVEDRSVAHLSTTKMTQVNSSRSGCSQLTIKSWKLSSKERWTTSWRSINDRNKYFSFKKTRCHSWSNLANTINYWK